ncbi:cytochrome c biogenesis protein CcsA [Desulfobacterales bacterium HSG16]|nr:cytochrome c biogenesis protein CcsA [Desulfobacterales bacterium HSG16]
MEILAIICVLLYLVATSCYISFLFYQKDNLEKIGFGAMALSFAVHTLWIGSHIFQSGVIPAFNLEQTLCLAGWATAGVFLIFVHKYKLKITGIIAAPLVTIAVFVSALLPAGPVPENTLFGNFWLIFHVIVILAGDACLAIACGLGLLYIIQERAIKTKKRGFFFNRLPALDILDAGTYACIASGFTLLTIGLVTGFVYARILWGHFWSNDPKEILSVITWLFYAALLHERLVAGWQGKKTAIMSVIGFVVILFTFLGVNFFLKGHHGIFTSW